MNPIVAVALLVASLGVAACGAGPEREGSSGPTETHPLVTETWRLESPAGVLATYGVWGFAPHSVLTVREDGTAELAMDTQHVGCARLNGTSLGELRRALEAADIAHLPTFDTSAHSPDGMVVEISGHELTFDGSTTAFVDGDPALPQRLLRAAGLLSELERRIVDGS